MSTFCMLSQKIVPSYLGCYILVFPFPPSLWNIYVNSHIFFKCLYLLSTMPSYCGARWLDWYLDGPQDIDILKTCIIDNQGIVWRVCGITWSWLYSTTTELCYFHRSESTSWATEYIPLWKTQPPRPTYSQKEFLYNRLSFLRHRKQYLHFH